LCPNEAPSCQPCVARVCACMVVCFVCVVRTCVGARVCVPTTQGDVGYSLGPMLLSMAPTAVLFSAHTWANDSLQERPDQGIGLLDIRNGSVVRVRLAVFPHGHGMACACARARARVCMCTRGLRCAVGFVGCLCPVPAPPCATHAAVAGAHGVVRNSPSAGRFACVHRGGEPAASGRHHRRVLPVTDHRRVGALTAQPRLPGRVVLFREALFPLLPLTGAQSSVSIPAVAVLPPFCRCYLRVPQPRCCVLLPPAPAFCCFSSQGVGLPPPSRVRGGGLPRVGHHHAGPAAAGAVQLPYGPCACGGHRLPAGAPAADGGVAAVGRRNPAGHRHHGGCWVCVGHRVAHPYPG
jgi:hypothetical protein